MNTDRRLRQRLLEREHEEAEEELTALNDQIADEEEARAILNSKTITFGRGGGVKRTAKSWAVYDSPPPTTEADIDELEDDLLREYE